MHTLGGLWWQSLKSAILRLQFPSQRIGKHSLTVPPGTLEVYDVDPTVCPDRAAGARCYR